MDTKFLRVGIGNKSILVEKGCSFENNNHIYYVNNNNSMSIFDKKNKTWTTGNNIKVNEGELAIIEAIANNTKEIENGKVLSGTVLSKKDLVDAIKQKHKNIFHADARPLLNKTNFEIKDSKNYVNQHALATEITNKNLGSCSNLIFKYGSKTNALEMSNRHTAFVNQRSLDAVPPLFKSKMKQIAKALKMSPQQLNEKIKQVAQNTGYSEYFVAHLVSLESFEPNVRDTKDGTITGGFGHTSLRDPSLKLGQKVTSESAFKWLESDIKFFEKKVKELTFNKNNTFGDYFDKLPLSIKEGLLDVAFNRGAGRLKGSQYMDLRTNMEKGYLASSAVLLRQEESKMPARFKTGLMERNVYRFLLATRDLAPHEIETAKKLFNKDGYFTKAMQRKRNAKLHIDARLMQRAWDSRK